MSGKPRIVLFGLGPEAPDRMCSLASLSLNLYCDLDNGDARKGITGVSLDSATDEELVCVMDDIDMLIVMALSSDQESKAIRLGEVANLAEVPFTLLAAQKGAFDQGSVSSHFRGIIVLDSDDVGELLSRILEIFMFPSLINLDLADLRTVLGYGREALVSCSEFPLMEHQEAQAPEGGFDLLSQNDIDAALVHIIGGMDLTVGHVDRICAEVSRKYSPKHLIMGVRIDSTSRAVPKVLSILAHHRES